MRPPRTAVANQEAGYAHGRLNLSTTLNSASAGSSLVLSCNLRGQHALGHLKVDEWIAIELRGNDVRPFIQDEMQDLVACHVKDGDGSAPGARVDMAANPALLVFGDPRPERLPVPCNFGRTLGPRRGSYQRYRHTRLVV